MTRKIPPTVAAIAAVATLTAALPANAADTIPREQSVRNVVLVHGAFADGSGWKGVYDNLTKRGYRVTIVQNPLTSLADDVAATARALERSFLSDIPGAALSSRKPVSIKRLPASSTSPHFLRMSAKRRLSNTTVLLLHRSSSSKPRRMDLAMSARTSSRLGLPMTSVTPMLRS